MVFRRIAEQREKLIIGRAEEHLDEDEKVLLWVRANRVHGRGDGFIFLTPNRIIVNLSGKPDDRSFSWDELRAWGISPDVHGGPVLALETDDADSVVQMRAQTSAMARDVAEFIQAFADLAPTPLLPVKGDPELGDFHPHESLDVKAHKLSIGNLARRIIVTVVGAALIIAAVLIIPLPGPWSILITIGGLAILSSEYDWAKDALEWAKRKYQQAKEKLTRRKQSN
jgi:uncharacterized protein (TIGR02611 family)